MASCLCIYHFSYNDDIQKTVEDSIQKLDNSGWNALKNKTSARDTAVATAEAAALAATSTIGTNKSILVAE